MQNIILLHGALGDKTDVKKLADLLCENYHVYTFNFSGHGQAPFRKEFNILQFSLELEEFINQQNLTQPHVFGYSMGGYVALNFASKNGGSVDRLITLGTKFNWDLPSVERETQSLQEDFLVKNSPNFLQTLKEKQGKNWSELLEKTRAMMFQLSQLNLIREETVSAIKNPVLLGIADHDKMVSFDETHRIFRSISNSSMYVLPHSKHPLESLNLELLSQIIHNFISVKLK